MTGVWSIVVAGGRATRYGGSRPKQLEVLGDGRRVLDAAVEAARAASDGVVLVVPQELLSGERSAADEVVAGGRTRSASVRAGLAVVPSEAEVVLVHDAARPMASTALFRAVAAAVLAGADGAVPAVSVTDTIKRVSGGRVVETLSREELVAVQTPQAFRADVLRRAHEGEPEGSDDAALVEALGATVLVVAGERANAKLTYAGDLDRLQR